jgi:dTDP-4-dehydrorhamnose 3,5-epimerase
MTPTPLSLPEVLLVESPVYRDARGYFQEVWHQAKHAAAGVPKSFVQDNLSFSKRGVVRGLHFQEPTPQGKLVCVLHGEIYDVVVDIRVGSPRFGQHAGVSLSAETGRQLYVPEGFAHGFAVTSETAIVLYKCTAPYNPSAEGSVRWDDPDLAIAWPFREALLSPKDAAAPRLAEVPAEKLPRYGAC